MRKTFGLCAKDEGAKRGIYAYLRVQEYFQLDPTGDYPDPPLQGQRLRGRNYQDVPVKTLPDGTLTVPSEILGLELRLAPASGEFRFYDTASGRVLPSHAELAKHVAEDAAARRTAEAEVERLQAELARLRGDTG